MVAYDAARCDEDRTAPGAGAQRPVEIFPVGEEIFVEEPDLGDRVGRDQHRATARTVDLVRRCASRKWRVAEADVPAVMATGRPKRCSGVPDALWCVREEDLAADRGCTRRSLEDGKERRYESRLDDHVVVEQENGCRATLECRCDAGVDTAREAAVVVESNEHDIRERGGNSIGAAVDRAVIDDDRQGDMLGLLERGEAAQRVVLPVPREDYDRDVVGVGGRRPGAVVCDVGHLAP